MLKPYSELRKIDVLPYCEERETKNEKGKTVKVPYLNWAKCKDLLHENGAEVVYFEPLVNDNGSTLFMTDIPFTDSKGNHNRCFEVRVKIVIDDLESVSYTHLDVYKRQPLPRPLKPINSVTTGSG